MTDQFPSPPQSSRWYPSQHWQTERSDVGNAWSVHSLWHYWSSSVDSFIPSLPHLSDVCLTLTMAFRRDLWLDPFCYMYTSLLGNLSRAENPHNSDSSNVELTLAALSECVGNVHTWMIVLEQRGKKKDSCSCLTTSSSTSRWNREG